MSSFDQISRPDQGTIDAKPLNDAAISRVKKQTASSDAAPVRSQFFNVDTFRLDLATLITTVSNTNTANNKIVTKAIWVLESIIHSEDIRHPLIPDLTPFQEAIDVSLKMVRNDSSLGTDLLIERVMDGLISLGFLRSQSGNDRSEKGSYLEDDIPTPAKTSTIKSSR